MSASYSPAPVDELLAQAGWLNRLARHLVRDRDVAEDVAQETWASVTRAPPQRGRAVRPWLAEVLTPCPPGAAAWSARPVDLTVNAAEGAEVEIRLDPAASVSGRVRDEAGQPVADALVQLSRQQSFTSEPALKTRSGGDGHYRIDGVLPGGYRARAVEALLPSIDATSVTVATADVDPGDAHRAHGRRGAVHAPGPRRGGGHGGGLRRRGQPAPGPWNWARTELVLRDGEHRQGISLTLPARGRIAGRVLDPGGAPAGSVTVIAAYEQDGRAVPSAAKRVAAAPDGSFAIEGLARGTHRVWAIHDRYPDAELPGVETGTADALLRFRPASSVAGVVVDGAGRPVADFVITARPGQRERGAVPRTRQVREASGAFALGRLPAGGHTLEATTSIGQRAKAEVTLAEGEARSGLRLVLEDSAQAAVPRN